MDETKHVQAQFVQEITERQILGKEFFSSGFLQSIDRNFKLPNVRIFFYSNKGDFLLAKDKESTILENKNDLLYRHIEENEVRNKIFKEALEDKLTYFSYRPKIYLSSQIIDSKTYDTSCAVQLLQENFQAYYSATLAFGINGCTELMFCKTKEEGDFTQKELTFLQELYMYVSNSYQTYKKLEQSKVISMIQSRIIEKGEKAFFIVDDFLHILNYNEKALECLKDVMGESIVSNLAPTNTNHWLHLILGSSLEETNGKETRTRIVKDYLFQIHTYDHLYSCEIVDRYHWITISKKEQAKQINYQKSLVRLTKTEMKVAELMYEGLTYNEIAQELVVSYHTVKKHVQNIYSKCEVTRRHELNRFLESE